MSELRQIEKRIFNENRIEEVLEYLDCWSISKEQRGKLYVAGLPDGENDRSVQVKNNEYLSSSIRSRGVSGSLFDIISYIVFDADTPEKRTECLSKSKYWVCEKLKYLEFIDEFYKVTSDTVAPTQTHTSWLKKIKKKMPHETPMNTVRDKSLLNHFGNVPYYKWFEDGLSIRTQKYFQVGIDVPSERITFPVHNSCGELVGVKGRYCGDNQEIENKYKYLYLISCNKSIEFFNLHRALPYIHSKKEVIVVEGGKTTMFLHQYGYPNSISIEGDSLSDIQIQLLKNLGLDITFIFAFDKDKDVEFVRNEAMKLSGRLKYGVIDTSNMLTGKDSPTDKGKEVWDDLYKNNLYKIV